MDTNPNDKLDLFELDFDETPETNPAATTTEEIELETVVVSQSAPVEETEPEEDEVLKANFEFLKEKGALALPDDYEFIATAEGFEKAIADSSENIQKYIVEDMFQNLPDEGRQLLKYYLEGGTSVSDFVKVFSAPDPSTIDLSDEANQEKVVRTLLEKTTKFSEAKIDKMINDYKSSFRLADEAEEAAAELKTLTEAEKASFVEAEKLRQAEAKKAAEEGFNSFKAAVSSITDINGVPFSKEDASKVLDAVYKPVKLTDGTVTTYFNFNLQKTLSDPKKVALLNKLMEADFKLDSLTRSKQSEATKQLRDKLKETQKFKTGANPISRGKFDANTATLDI